MARPVAREYSVQNQPAHCMRGGCSAGGTASARICLRRLCGPSTAPGPGMLSGRWMVLTALSVCLLHVDWHEAGDGFVDQAHGAIDVGVRDLQGRIEILIEKCWRATARIQMPPPDMPPMPQRHA